LAQLGNHSIYIICGRRDSNIRAAPESLTRCGRETPTGIYERIPGLLIEVRSDIALFLLVA
jgi:hypothetical protein